MPDIAIIATDKHLSDLAKQVMKKQADPVAVVAANYDTCLEHARRAVQNGAKVLISRGAYTDKLRNSGVDVPVVDIPISGYNVAMMLAQAREISKRIAVVGFEDLGLVKGVVSLGPILGLAVQVFMVTSHAEIKGQVAAARSQGFQVIVGSYRAAVEARGLGLNGFFVQSSRAEVEQAFFEAGKVLTALRYEREWGETFKMILDSIDDGMIFIDRQKQILHCNETLGRQLGIPPASTLNKPVETVLPNPRFLERLEQPGRKVGEIYEFRGLSYVCNLVPVEINSELIGTVATFQEVAHWQNVEHAIRRNLFHKGHVTKYTFADIIGQSRPIQQVVELAKQYALVDSTILIQGETGTGKEILAQSLHSLSPRRQGPFVAVNCASIPENLLEAEFFGYVEGAFTGARKSGKSGLFELAHNGTIFLDEIGEISPHIQSRLLRVLEERQVMRIGDDKVLPVNVRVIAATNQDLHCLIRKGQFREDLYYRLNILNLSLPPLRQRKEDIPLLARYFLAKAAQTYGKQAPALTAEVVSMFVEHDWPGNIRELRNAMERMVITFSGLEINREMVLRILGEAWSRDWQSSWPEMATDSVKSLEIRSIRRVLVETDNNIAKSARRLGISRSTLYRKLKRIEQNNQDN